jgi:hypothetical protein
MAGIEEGGMGARGEGQDRVEKLIAELEGTRRYSEELLERWGRFRGQIRDAIAPVWKSNPGVTDEEIVEAVRTTARGHADC